MKQETNGGSFIFWRYSAISGSERAAIHHPPTTYHPPPTTHPPSVHGPTQYCGTAMQQYVEQYTGQASSSRFALGGICNCLLFHATPRPSEPSPGGRFPCFPLAEVGHRRPFFRRHVVVLLCGWDVAAPRGRRRPCGALESPLFGGGAITKIFYDSEKRHE